MPDLIHKTMASKKRLPQGNGSILRMRRYNNLNTATVPLGPSGLNPPAQVLSALKRSGAVKPTLIDMEARWGDMAQAKAA